jgi:hypothetical protein
MDAARVRLPSPLRTFLKSKPRHYPLLERKRRLFSVMPTIEARLLHLDHLDEGNSDLFRVACQVDLGHRGFQAWITNQPILLTPPSSIA